MKIKYYLVHDKQLNMKRYLVPLDITWTGKYGHLSGIVHAMMNNEKLKHRYGFYHDNNPSLILTLLKDYDVSIREACVRGLCLNPNLSIYPDNLFKSNNLNVIKEYNYKIDTWTEDYFKVFSEFLIKKEKKLK